jgi:hypothetical protein
MINEIYRSNNIILSNWFFQIRWLNVHCNKVLKNRLFLSEINSASLTNMRPTFTPQAADPRKLLRKNLKKNVENQVNIIITSWWHNVLSDRTSLWMMLKWFVVTRCSVTKLLFQTARRIKVQKIVMFRVFHPVML